MTDEEFKKFLTEVENGKEHLNENGIYNKPTVKMHYSLKKSFSLKQWAKIAEDKGVKMCFIKNPQTRREKCYLLTEKGRLKRIWQ